MKDFVEGGSFSSLRVSSVCSASSHDPLYILLPLGEVLAGVLISQILGKGQKVNV